MDLSLLFKATMKLPLEWDITDIVTDQSHLKMNISLTYLPKECECEVCKTSSEIISYHEDAWRYMDFMAFQCFIQTKLPVYHCSSCNKEFITKRPVESSSNGMVFDSALSTLPSSKK